MPYVVTGLFNSTDDAARATQELEANGVLPEKISLVAPETVDRATFEVETHSKLPEGTAVGAAGGGAIGALVAGLTAVGTIGTGGVGLLAAGPLVAAFTGAGAGATGGGILGAIVGSAVPEHEIKHYEQALGEGNLLIGVECESAEKRDVAKRIFDECNAERIASV